MPANTADDAVPSAAVLLKARPHPAINPQQPQQQEQAAEVVKDEIGEGGLDHAAARAFIPPHGLLLKRFSAATNFPFPGPASGLSRRLMPDSPTGPSAAPPSASKAQVFVKRLTSTL